MMTVVIRSSTIVPMIDPREEGIPIFDEQGDPLIGGRAQAIMDAINALHRKIDRMSDTNSRIKADVDTVVASNARLETDMDTIKTLLANIKPGEVVDPATLDALHAAAGISSSLADEADAMVKPADPEPQA